jgi:large subunit ribosomal protein L16
MLKMPKRVAYRKMAKRGQVKGITHPRLIFGEMARVASMAGRVTARQLEAARRTIRHHMARQGKLWVRVFPQRAVTAKPREVRMGGGAGSVRYWCAVVKPGCVRFELRGVHVNVGRAALTCGAKKLPIGAVRWERDPLRPSR